MESTRTVATPAPAAEDPLAEAAALARSARSGLETYESGPQARRLGMVTGCAAAALVVCVVLGIKLFGSGSRAPSPPVVSAARPAPEYPPEVSQVLAGIESALKKDDFAAARIDVDRLRRLAPSHPRLGFFESLLARHPESKSGPSQAAAGAKHSRKPRKPTDTVSDALAPDAPSDAMTTAVPSRSNASVDSQRPADSTAASAVANVQSRSEAMESSTAPAAPPGGLKVPPAETSPTATIAGASGSAPSATERTVRPAAAEPVATAAAPATQHLSSEDPPPVVREAKLLRRVDPEYPTAARRDGVAGSVDLAVLVSESGAVREVSVVRADPPGLFDKSALTAVRKWKYDPRYVDGLPAEAHLTVHLEFAPNR